MFVSPIVIPEIHEEPVASVLRILQLKPVDDDSGDSISQFDGESLPQMHRIYGGQVIAQALLAAGATVDAARLPHSLHAYFLRGGDPDQSLRFRVDPLRDGRSFSARSVTTWQQDRQIFTMTASFQEAEDGLDLQSQAPRVPAPEELRSALELFRTIDHPVAKFLGKTAAFDVRHVQRSLYVEPSAPQTDHQELWMKIRADVPQDTPQIVQRALLAYVIDQVMLEPSLRSASLTWGTAGLSLASLDHSMWFHRDVSINEWLLFQGRSSSVSNSRAKSEISVYSREGELVATASQEGMVRIPSGARSVTGRWTFTE